MKEYILLLPIIFIFHDMEEIIGFVPFFRKNLYLYERFPKVMNAYRGLTTEGMAVGVYEEFIPFFGISLLAYFFPGRVLYGLWYGIFLSMTAHFIVHIGHTLYIRKYIPSFITSIICLPISILILIKCAAFVNFDILTVTFIIVGILLMIANLRLAHMLSHFVNRKLRSAESYYFELPE